MCSISICTFFPCIFSQYPSPPSHDASAYVLTSIRLPNIITSLSLWWNLMAAVSSRRFHIKQGFIFPLIPPKALIMLTLLMKLLWCCPGPLFSPGLFSTSAWRPPWQSYLYLSYPADDGLLSFFFIPPAWMYLHSNLQTVLLFEFTLGAASSISTWGEMSSCMELWYNLIAINSKQ